MPFPTAGLHARGLDTFWIAVHRNSARSALAEARGAMTRAADRFETALHWQAQGEDKLAAEWIDLAFRTLEAGRYDLRRAKEAALLAVRGTPLEAWTAAKRRAHREEREAWCARVSA